MSRNLSKAIIFIFMPLTYRRFTQKLKYETVACDSLLHIL